MKETLAKDYLIDALGDSETKWRVYQARPRQLEDAVTIAVELEAFGQAESRKSAPSRKLAARTVEKKEDAPVTSNSVEELTKEGGDTDGGSVTSADSDKQQAGVTTSWVLQWTNEELKELQIQDNDLGPIVLWKQVQNSRPTWEQVACKSSAAKNYWTQWNRLALRNGILYRSFESHAGDKILWQLVVPRKLQGHILEQAHGHRLSGHLMVRKTLSRIRDHYYWSGYRKAVEKWCKQCDLCAARKNPTKRPNAKLKRYTAGELHQ
ncbi:hypothetical protein HOLleu_43170 [Holothuria leucospilota]|uniref:Integrase zinc-binding domain-containing protein n=1 Tax=Holothuria leucospilota TaxID=206669 RepID=A0A9Q0YC07_HOLLE|nr:hypothetical protein HOLleu_43170 [Holothuria leucospilota]